MVDLPIHTYSIILLCMEIFSRSVSPLRDLRQYVLEFSASSCWMTTAVGRIRARVTLPGNEKSQRLEVAALQHLVAESALWQRNLALAAPRVFFGKLTKQIIANVDVPLSEIARYFWVGLVQNTCEVGFAVCLAGISCAQWIAIPIDPSWESLGPLGFWASSGLMAQELTNTIIDSIPNMAVESWIKRYEIPCCNQTLQWKSYQLLSLWKIIGLTSKVDQGNETTCAPAWLLTFLFCLRSCILLAFGAELLEKAMERESKGGSKPCWITKGSIKLSEKTACIWFITRVSSITQDIKGINLGRYGSISGVCVYIYIII